MKMLFFILLTIGSIYCTGCETQAMNLDEFANCLTDKGVKMYGADWCPHCQNQKKIFGSSFDKVSYIQCDKDPAICKEKAIEGFPTWIFPSGERISGEQELSVLSEKSACLLPKETTSNQELGQ